MVRLFVGYDRREAAGSFIFTSSVLRRASCPVSFSYLGEGDLQTGTNAFTVSRFTVPYLCGYQGKAIFADGADMICVADIAEILTELEAMTSAVKVVKHEYKTKHSIKYRETELESPNIDYPRKNWASLMLINCEHQAWRNVSPPTLLNQKMIDLLTFKFMLDDEIEEISDSGWNRLVDEGQAVEGAKILHWTAGIPAFKYYENSPGAELWWDECRKMTYPLPT